jgi:hypothetical protein
MMRAHPIVLVALAASFLAVTPALSQSTCTNPSFTFFISPDGVLSNLSAGSLIGFPATNVGSSSSAMISILNSGSTVCTVQSVTVSGVGYQASGLLHTPATVIPGQQASFTVTFTPRTTGTSSGALTVALDSSNVVFLLSGAGTASSFSLSYIDPETSNTLPLPNNSTLPFPNTLAGTTTVVNVVATNNGTGAGVINSIALSGAASVFQLLNLPALPVSVPPSQQLRFAIRFAPQQQQSFAGKLVVAFDGQPTSVNLQAQGIQPQFTYQWAIGTNATPISPGGTIAIPDTAVGQTTNVVVSVQNTGMADGQIPNISVTGQGLSLTGLPALPFTLHPSGLQYFTLNFAPAQPGAISGLVAIGADTLNITGTGIGPRLTYSYTSGSSAVSVADSGVVIFPPLAVGSTERLSFSIQNTGTSAATISSINLAAASTIFSLSQLPALPMSLDPGASVAFPIRFVPNNTGSLSATLLVNSTTFTLSGSGMQPAPLSTYHFQGPSANGQPAQQAAVGLTLDTPYPSDVTGTLTLTFASGAFADDSSIQFATGGRTVNFTIPANATQALFPGNTTAVGLQTGTTTGTIVITPSFATQGSFNLTPSSPALLSLTIPRSAPQLLNAAVSNATLSSFTLTVSGFSTTCDLGRLDIQITPKQGQNFSTTHLPIDVTSASSAWFAGAASQGFGGSFLLAISFNLSNGSTSDDLVHLLQSLTVTATNAVGGSNTVSVPVP